MAVIAIDLDGVCYEWQRTYRYMMRLYRGVAMPPVEEFWHYWNAPDQFTTAADRKWMWSEGVRLGLFRYGHMVKDTRVALEHLAEAGHKLVIVTHRPANAVQDTLDWVSLFFKDIPLTGFSILSNGEPKTDVPWDILVDDKTENFLEAFDKGRKAVLFDQPWNQDIGLLPGQCRAKDWLNVVHLINTGQV